MKRENDQKYLVLKMVGIAEHIFIIYCTNHLLMGYLIPFGKTSTVPQIFSVRAGKKIVFIIILNIILLIFFIKKINM